MIGVKLIFGSAASVAMKSTKGHLAERHRDELGVVPCGVGSGGLGRERAPAHPAQAVGLPLKDGAGELAVECLVGGRHDQ